MNGVTLYHKIQLEKLLHWVKAKNSRNQVIKLDIWEHSPGVKLVASAYFCMQAQNGFYILKMVGGKSKEGCSGTRAITGHSDLSVHKALLAHGHTPSFTSRPGLLSLYSRWAEEWQWRETVWPKIFHSLALYRESWPAPAVRESTVMPPALIPPSPGDSLPGGSS